MYSGGSGCFTLLLPGNIRTLVERPPSPTTIPLIRPYFVWRTVFYVCTMPDQPTIPLTRPATESDGIFSLANDHIAYSRTPVQLISDRGQHILHIIPIGGSTQRTQKRLRMRGWWRVPLIVLTPNDRTSMVERKHNISTSEERIEWQTEWRGESHQLWGLYKYYV